MNETRLERLLQLLNPEEPDTFLLYALALEYRSMGQPEQAMAYFLKIKDNDAGYLAVYYQLASLYVETGSTQEAEKTYLEGIVLATTLNEMHTLNELKQAYQQLRDEQEF